MQITWYGHSAFRIETANVVLMLDPFFDNPTWDGDTEAAWEGTDYVAVTHGHGDHVGSTVALAKATGATVIANPEICKFVGESGVSKREPINFGGELTLAGFSITYVPAWHSSSSDGGGTGRYLGTAGGFIIRAEGEKTLYAMGDTGIFGDMQLIAELYEPKIGLVPIGDRFTMGGKLAATACRRYFAFDAVIPCHYGTFGLIDPDASKFMEGMKGGPTQVVVPQRGEAVTL